MGPAAARKPGLDLTNRECELVAAAWLSTQNPHIDWDKFATIAGFKNAHSARTCFGPLKKKLQEKYGNGKPANRVVKSYEWTPRQRKRKAVPDIDTAEEPSNPGENLPASAVSAITSTTKNSTDDVKDPLKGTRDFIDLDATEDEEEDDDPAMAAAVRDPKRQKMLLVPDVLHVGQGAYDMEGVV
ncbi:hypothetical protein MAPG_04770 [Magnaporthiopsis poae ATCC 64411]|uniref:Myb-like domain-containing protein n=1 Tax=Magnaporthiopsis poae (strain ATCC 64411 / 73-15) TaxID=644358 RepID=A0A0C4DXL6_MAGP6|nr:hypothetical protein MAPG_04770 [Magnaporthiopsis poae ATCC 64411]